jgi:hypothetical protein
MSIRSLSPARRPAVGQAARGTGSRQPLRLNGRYLCDCHYTTNSPHYIILVYDLIAGDVYEHFWKPQSPGTVVETGLLHFSEDDAVPISGAEFDAVFCRVLGPADMQRVRDIHSRLAPKYRRLPLLDGEWHQVHYD